MIVGEVPCGSTSPRDDCFSVCQVDQPVFESLGRAESQTSRTRSLATNRICWHRQMPQTRQQMLAEAALFFSTCMIKCVRSAFATPSFESFAVQEVQQRPLARFLAAGPSRPWRSHRVRQPASGRSPPALIRRRVHDPQRDTHHSRQLSAAPWSGRPPGSIRRSCSEHTDPLSGHGPTRLSAEPGLSQVT